MDKKLITAMLEALAVGDSFGKGTEFASRFAICSAFDSIDKLLTPEESLKHTDMRYAQVTDDTEQNVFLIEDYLKADAITAEVAAKSILRWFDETPEPEKYIGPSSAKAIAAIKAGEPLAEAGKTGASCGGVMRAPAACLCSNTLEELQNNVFCTLYPTHNTPLAMEAAMGYSYALWAMERTKDVSEITKAAKDGCRYGLHLYEYLGDRPCAPSCTYRIDHLLSVWDSFDSEKALLDFIFYVYGTTLSSCDVFIAAYALFLWAKEDVFLSIKMAAMLGGDTDTIACLAAVLCCCYGGGHNIPDEIVQAVRENNEYDFDKLADDISKMKG